MHPDDRLLRKAQRGDGRAFAALVEPEQHRLFTLAVRELGSQADAEDAVQEALLRAWRSLPRFRGEASFSTWLYRICLNAVHDVRARRRRSATLPFDQSPEPQDARDRFAEGELAHDLGRALQAIDETYRTAVLLYDVLGCSYAEIAAILEIPEGTVKSRIFRGRTELARRLGTVPVQPQSNE